MVKILQATSRGQITLPKKWRDSFDTNYFKVEVKSEKLIIVPLKSGISFGETLEDSWNQYKKGDFVSHEELKEKYGL